MKKGSRWLVVGCLVVVMLILTSCKETTTKVEVDEKDVEVVAEEKVEEDIVKKDIVTESENGVPEEEMEVIEEEEPVTLELEAIEERESTTSGTEVFEEEPTIPELDVTEEEPVKPDIELTDEEISIEIRGKSDFKHQTEQALLLLRNKAPTAYKKVQLYIGIIEQNEHSGMWAYENPPRFTVGDATAFYSVTWYAGAIAHDATHSELFNEYKSEHGEPVPDNVWTGEKVEMFCMLYQADVLASIDASQYEID